MLHMSILQLYIMSIDREEGGNIRMSRLAMVALVEVIGKDLPVGG